jgi:threonine/homoserine/homoserine lactone efflux protein
MMMASVTPSIVLFAGAFGLGMVFNLAPGAVFAETLRRGLHEGYAAALAVQVGSLIGDATWAILGLAGVGLLLQSPAVRLPISVVSGLYLLWLAWRSFADAWEARRAASPTVADPRAAARGAFGAGVVLSLTNPQNLAYWSAMGAAMGVLGVTTPTASQFLVFFCGFMASSVAAAFLCAWFVDAFRRRAGVTWRVATYSACGLLLGWLGGDLLLEAWRR